MAKKKGGSAIGAWAFLIGVIIAVIIALFALDNTTLVWILAVIGIIVGLLNVTDDEAHQFLFSAVALLLVAALGRDAVSIVPILANILNALLVLFVPATVIVAIRNVFSVAKH
jgi:uncharacterized membrane protein